MILSNRLYIGRIPVKASRVAGEQRRRSGEIVVVSRPSAVASATL